MAEPRCHINVGGQLMGLRCRRWLASDRSPAAVGNASFFPLFSRTRPKKMLEVPRGITEISHGCRLSPWKVGNDINRASSIRSGADVSGCRLEAEMRRHWWSPTYISWPPSSSQSTFPTAPDLFPSLFSLTLAMSLNPLDKRVDQLFRPPPD